MRIRSIVGFPAYAVSDCGVVFSLHGIEPRVIRPQLFDGYWRARLRCPRTKKTKTKRIHRLVAEMFVKKTDKNHTVVDHKDRNRLNNNYKNLRWSSQSDNLLNTKMSSRNSSGFRGVHPLPGGKWRAHISIDRNVKTIGRFNNKNDAIEARKKALRKFKKKCFYEKK